MIYNSLLKTSALIALALFAFAANSIIARLALGSGSISASSFTILRLLSGAIVLLLIMKINRNISNHATKGSWSAGFMLFIYAATFSYAYISLDTGIGALILFASVQITMILISLISGVRLRAIEWLGLITAFFGFVYLILPNITKPSVFGFLLMSVSGIAWGIYTLQGRNSRNPLMDTAYNFFRTIPFIIVLAIFTIKSDISYSFEGVFLALLSGGVTSGIGYTIWYIALGRITATSAAVLQLSVPIIAALGGVVFVSEEITPRLIISFLMVMGGILMVILGKYYYMKKI